MSRPKNHQASRLARITASRDGTPEIAGKERLVDTAHLVGDVPPNVEVWERRAVDGHYAARAAWATVTVAAAF
jgi:hypothetical protein